MINGDKKVMMKDDVEDLTESEKLSVFNELQLNLTSERS